MLTPLKFLYVYLTDNCNLRCAHCWQSAPEDDHFRYLKLEDCKPFLDGARTLGLQNVTLSGGEPMMSPAFVPFLDYFRRNRIHCGIETNGTLINGERLKAIERCRPYCAVSLDGFTAETHNAQRRRPDAFQMTVQGLQNLQNAGLTYQLIMSVSKANYSELVPLLNWVRDEFTNCEKFKINIILPEGRAQEMLAEDLFGPLDLVRIGETIGDIASNYPFKLILHVEPLFLSLKNITREIGCGGSCGYHKGLSILANGLVSICSLGKLVPEYVFGHVSDIDLEKTWTTNPFLTMIRETGYSKLKGVCQQCVFRKRCLGGCRAVALQTYGDFFAPSPACQAYFETGQVPRTRLVSLEPNRFAESFAAVR